MQKPQEDLSGRVFGQWTVICLGGKRSQNWHWVCRCSCGTTREVASYHLRHGNSKCCVQCSGKKASVTCRAKRRSANGRLLHKASGLGSRTWSKERQDQFNKQNGICPVCTKPLPPDQESWAWDHDHTTDECRSLLHRGCNVFIGRLENFPGIVERSVKYLEEWRTT